MEQTSFFSEKGMKKTKGKKKKKEESLQIFLSQFMRLKYPDIIFNSDIASGMHLPIWIAAKAKAQRSSRGMPDMVILEPRGKYHFLAIELKNTISDVYLKDGLTISNTKSNKHVLEQDSLLKRLRDKGAFAVFGFGRDGCMRIIDEYMSL